MFEHGYALLIGVDENKVSRLALPIVKKDTEKLKEVITHPDRCGYPDDHVRVLTGKDATREKIVEGLEWLKTNLAVDASENQTVLVYYSGHGHRTDSGDFYLVPYDFRLPVSLGAMPAAAFAEGIAALNPRRLLAILDCCHAEGMNVKDLEGGSPVASAALTPDSKGMSILATGDGRAVLSSSRGTQKSWIRNDGRMSVFTYHLAEALTGHAGRPAEPEVLVTEVMDYVARRVPETAQADHQAEQQPAFRFSGTAFPIALVLGGKGVEKDVGAPDPLAELPPRIVSTLTVDKVAKDARATNVEVETMRRGEVHAKTNVTTAEGEVTGVKVKEIL